MLSLRPLVRVTLNKVSELGKRLISFCTDFPETGSYHVPTALYLWL